ncbi:translation initiation factor IF-2 associated domain-containing protein, partial [Macromonas nakdongensis]|uniref:translation initiation factor IF-2 associated domain-containing protein n=1 Tax=Macromonas nakdongensis TaxID=1843082 RepID=UPI0018E2C36D
MSSNTVAEFAAELNKPTSLLLEQLASAGVQKHTGVDPISESDKHKLLSYLQASHGTSSAERKKITLTKKSTTEIKQADATGRARTIQVEVRKKRTFIKRDDEPALGGTDEEEDVQPAVDTAELARREEEARHQAELLQRQEEELAQKRREREEQEAR